MKGEKLRNGRGKKEKEREEEKEGCVKRSVGIDGWGWLGVEGAELQKLGGRCFFFVFYLNANIFNYQHLHYIHYKEKRRKMRMKRNETKTEIEGRKNWQKEGREWQNGTAIRCTKRTKKKRKPETV